MEPIRVLQVVTKMDRGGLESRLMEVYRNMDRTRVQFDFYTCRKDKGVFDDEITALGGKIYYEAPLSAARFWEIPRRFKAFLTAHPEYKIIHAQMNHWCGLILKGAKQAGVGVRIAHSMTALSTVNAKNIVKNIIKLPTNKYATHKWAVSHKAGAWLFGRRADERGEVTVWPNSVDCMKFRCDPAVRAEVRAELGLGDSHTLIHVGNMRPVKNHKFIVDIFAEYAKEHDSRLVLVGEDRMDGEVRRHAEALGVADKISFLGARGDIPRLLQAGDVFVFPSLYEGFPGSVLEAEAAGLPCLISDTVTDEVCLTPEAVRLPLGDTAPWVAKIEEMRAVPRYDTYALLAEKGYDISTLVPRMCEFYEGAGNGFAGAF